MMLSNAFRISECMICLLSCVLPVGISAQERTPEWVYSVPEETIRGIRYFEDTQIISPFRLYNSLGDLRYSGFILNPEDENTFIAPDGKVVPAFCQALRVVSPDAYNGYKKPPKDAPSSYSGDIYIPDYIEGFVNSRDEFVLFFAPRSIAENVVSLRTPLYAEILTEQLSNAVNLQKVQIGACYYVHPDAFLNCNKLEAVIFEQAPYVFEQAFTDCVGINTIVLRSEQNLPLLEGASVFEKCIYESATVYVPDTLMEACKNDPVWGRFVHIKSLEECTVESVKP